MTGGTFRRGRALVLAVSVLVSGCSRCGGPAEPDASASRAAAAGGADASVAATTMKPTVTFPDAGPPPVLERDVATLQRDASCPPDMIAVPIGGCIDRHEASQGADGVPVSAAKKMPHTGVTVVEAAQACEKAGKYLCGEAQWVSACQGKARNEYPYGPKFEPKRCNDWDLSEGGKQGVLATGSLPGCVTPDGAFDMANNVAELTAHTGGGNMYEVRGGSFFTTVHDSACDEDDNRVSPDQRFPSVGYRCCTDGKRAAR